MVSISLRTPGRDFSFDLEECMRAWIEFARQHEGPSHRLSVFDIILGGNRRDIDFRSWRLPRDGIDLFGPQGLRVGTAMFEIANAICREAELPFDVELTYTLPSESTQPRSDPPGSLTDVIDCDDADEPELRLQTLVQRGEDKIDGDCYSRAIWPGEETPDTCGWVYREMRSEVQMRHELDFTRTVSLVRSPPAWDDAPEVAPDDNPLDAPAARGRLWREEKPSAK